MTIEQITQFILDNFPGSQVLEHEGDYFYYADKSLVGSSTVKPFATLVTKDNEYDNASKLDREGVFRFNLGLNKPDFDSLISVQAPSRDFGSYLQTDIDFTTQDQIIPHPIYGTVNRISVLNPSEEMINKLKPYIEKGYTNQLKQIQS